MLCPQSPFTPSKVTDYMKLLDLVARQPVPEPWAEGDKIPWNNAAFSERMLHEHLSQAHDLASRRSDRIDLHVDWIHGVLLGGRPSTILDLGCGPGLYATRLARKGHTVTGIDFGPASVTYARQQAAAGGLACEFIEADIRQANYGEDRFDLAMLIFGEFNVFHPDDARTILRKVHAALKADGVIVLEVHTVDVVRRVGEEAASWHSSNGGLFSARPHLLLTENFWLPERQIAIERYFVVDAESGEITRHASAMQAYSEEQLRTLLVETGFTQVTLYPSLYGAVDEGQADFYVVCGRRTTDDE